MRNAHWIAAVSLVATLGCSNLTGDTNSAASVSPQAESDLYLVGDVVAPQPAGFNLCTNPQDGITMFTPPGFEWESPENFFAAMNNADPSISGGNKETTDDPIQLFDATPENLVPELYPARIVVQRLPNMSVGRAKSSFAKDTSSGWAFKGNLKTTIGEVPLYEKTVEEAGLKGAPVNVIKRRYVLCWKEKSIAVYTYCPARLAKMGYNLEQAVLSVRLQKFSEGTPQMLPPESKKNEQFNTDKKN